MRVTIIGAGKVGRSLADAIASTPHQVELHPARAGVPGTRIRGALVLLAVRDDALSTWAVSLAARGRVSRQTAVAHLAGSLAADVLAPLRGICAGVAQAHPAVSFPSPGTGSHWRGAALLVSGDPVAVRRARTIGRAIGLVPFAGDLVDPVTYHTACALLANGTAAVADAAVRLLVTSGVPKHVAPLIAGPLLRIVGENVTQLGVPGALSGPVRRGDAATLHRHLSRLTDCAPDVVPLYLELLQAQLPMAIALGEASPEGIRAIQDVVQGARARAGLQTD